MIKKRSVMISVAAAGVAGILMIPTAGGASERHRPKPKPSTTTTTKKPKPTTTSTTHKPKPTTTTTTQKPPGPSRKKHHRH